MATGAIIQAGTDYDRLVGGGVITSNYNTAIGITGGTITRINIDGDNYVQHRFTASGNFVIPAYIKDLEIEFLVVAGGGGAGAGLSGASGGGVVVVVQGGSPLQSQHY
jgi:hypothetical protein